MKKFLSAALAIIMLASLFGCTKQEQTKVFDKAEFKYKNAKCEVIDDSSKEMQISFVTGADELIAYSDNASKVCNLDTINTDGSFNNIIKAYDKEFFTNNYLILIRRYHTTADALAIEEISFNDGLFSVLSSLKAGEETESSFRIYAIELDKSYYVKEAGVDLKVVEDEQSSVKENSIIISKGENHYKLITADEVKNEIASLIQKSNFTQNDNVDIGEYKVRRDDIIITFNDTTALLTESFVILDSTSYAPNNEVRNKLLQIYNEIESENMTLQAIVD